MFKNAIKLIVSAFVVFATSANAQSSNACNVLKSHENWSTALKAANEKYGISAGAIMAIIDQESRFRANASNGPYQGFSQASPQTWNWFLRDAGMGSRARSDFAASALFVGWHFKTMSRKLGIPVSNVTSQYLVYKLGEGGYKKGGSRGSQNIAVNVARRAEMFDNQLKTCGF